MCFSIFQEFLFPGSGHLVLLEQHEQHHMTCLEKDFPFGGNWSCHSHISPRPSALLQRALLWCHICCTSVTCWTTHKTQRETPQHRDTERNTTWFREQKNCSYHLDIFFFFCTRFMLNSKRLYLLTTTSKTLWSKDANIQPGLEPSQPSTAANELYPLIALNLFLHRRKVTTSPRGCEDQMIHMWEMSKAI